jgi:hypothetical protein
MAPQIFVPNEERTVRISFMDLQAAINEVWRNKIKPVPLIRLLGHGPIRGILDPELLLQIALSRDGLLRRINETATKARRPGVCASTRL